MKANKYNIDKSGISFELYKFIKRYYNTGTEVVIYKNKDILLYDGIITLSTQGTGTETQKHTYLNMQINEFINNIKKLNK